MGVPTYAIGFRWAIAVNRVRPAIVILLWRPILVAYLVDVTNVIHCQTLPSYVRLRQRRWRGNGCGVKLTFRDNRRLHL